MYRRLMGITVLGAALPPLAASADGHQFEIITSQHSYLLTELASGLEHPWGLDWLPDGRMIVTERPGRIRIIGTDGTVSEPLGGVPEIVSEFRDGLHDIAVSPEFESDQTVFFSYSKKEGDLRWLEITAARLGDGQLEDLRIVHDSGVQVAQDQGFGSRLRFDADGNLVASVGDHNEPPNSQDNDNSLGTIIRITTDGAAAPGNPGIGPDGITYAYGFKNPQGITIHPDTGDIWATDHGGTGGGELNLVATGGNHGWPVRTFGIGDAPRAEEPGDFVEPVFTWGVAPTVALSGLELYTGDEFPNWTGDLFVGSLFQAALIRIMLNDAGAIIGTEYVIDGDIGRVREVRTGPDGRLYVLNDEPDGGIFRIDPTN